MIDLRHRFAFAPVPNEAAVDFLFDLFTILAPISLVDVASQASFCFPFGRPPGERAHKIEDRLPELGGCQMGQLDLGGRVAQLGHRGIELVMNVVCDSRGLFDRQASRRTFGHCFLDDLGQFVGG